MVGYVFWGNKTDNEKVSDKVSEAGQGDRGGEKGVWVGKENNTPRRSYPETVTRK